MRKLILSLVLSLVAVGAVAVTPASSEAGPFRRWGANHYYSGYYNPGYYGYGSYYNPGYSSYYYNPGYYGYYASPWARSYYYNPGVYSYSYTAPAYRSFYWGY